MNDIINYHYDHAEVLTVTGVNLLTAMVKYDDVAFSERLKLELQNDEFEN